MIAVEVDGTTVEHVCEIQIHLRHVTEYCEAQKSHESYNFFRVFFNGSMNTVAARLQDLEEIVGPGFAGKDTDIETPEAVLQRLVLDVETSKNVRRIEALELFCRDYLQEFELSLYMAQRKLDVQRATLQHDDHPDIGKSYTNMAFVIEKQGKFSEAEAMHKKALAIQLKTVGEGHIDVVSSEYLLNYSSPAPPPPVLPAVSSAISSPSPPSFSSSVVAKSPSVPSSYAATKSALDVANTIIRQYLHNH